MRFLFRLYVVATVLILFVFSACVVYGFAQSSVFAPIWMKEDAYVEFFFDEGIRFPSSDSTAGVAYENGTYRWECIELTGTLAKLSLTLSYTDNVSVTKFSGEVLVDAINRSCYSLDGALLGTTQLWLEADPADGEEVVLWDVPPDKIFGTVETNRVGETSQGKQESYKVSSRNGTIGGNTAVFDARYDTNTGLMIRGLLWNEPTLTALNTGILNSVTISDTNIDLGPSTDVFDFSALLPPIIIIVAFVAIFVTIYWKRSKKHK